MARTVSRYDLNRYSVRLELQGAKEFRPIRRSSRGCAPRKGTGLCWHKVKQFHPRVARREKFSWFDVPHPLAWRPDCPKCGQRMVEATLTYTCPDPLCLGVVAKEDVRDTRREGRPALNQDTVEALYGTVCSLCKPAESEAWR